MKTKLRLLLQSIAILLALTLLFSLIFSCLYYFNAISTNTFHILNWIGGMIAFCAGGWFLGQGVTKKALLHALVVVGIMLIPSLLLLPAYTLMNLVEVASKSLSFILICMLTFTKMHKA